MQNLALKKISSPLVLSGIVQNEWIEFEKVDVDILGNCVFLVIILKVLKSMAHSEFPCSALKKISLFLDWQ
jgi:hypothetical protein